MSNRRQVITRLRDIWQYVSEHPRCSVRELSAKCGYSSRGGNGALFPQLEKLRDAGYITWEPKRARTLRALIPLLFLSSKGSATSISTNKPHAGAKADVREIMKEETNVTAVIHVSRPIQRSSRPH